MWALLSAMEGMAAAHAATVAQVALRWLLQRRVVTGIVLGVKSVAQLRDNLGALAFELTPAEVARLDELSAPAAVYPYEMVWRVNASRNRPGSTVGGALLASGGK